MIEEIPLNFKFNPTNSKLNYPQCRCGNCPQFYFNLLSVASRGSGKTQDANPIFKALSSLDEADIHDKFRDELSQSIVDDITKNKEETEIYQKYIKAYQKQLK